jgi:hypothetical protein
MIYVVTQSKIMEKLMRKIILFIVFLAVADEDVVIVTRNYACHNNSSL